jgi:glycosyltransferase involved in cell wall biosynthesis
MRRAGSPNGTMVREHSVTRSHPEGAPCATVVVPTRDSARTVGACLASISRQSYENLEVIVVDNSSSDATQRIALEHDCAVLTAGPERSTQRNVGASRASGAYLLFVDSDMVLEPGVILECVKAARAGADAVIVPEVSFGDGFWAQCKRLERSCYVGDDDIEAARFYARDLFVRLDGFDELLRGPEDWDLSQRARDAGATIARVSARIHHDEGHLKLTDLLGKKLRYGKSMPAYRRKHRRAARRQSLLVRPAFIRHRRALAAEPLTAAGMLLMKSLELAAGAVGASSAVASDWARSRSSGMSSIVG